MSLLSRGLHLNNDKMQGATEVWSQEGFLISLVIEASVLYASLDSHHVSYVHDLLIADC